MHAAEPKVEYKPAGHVCAVTNPVQFQLIGSIVDKAVLLVLFVKVILYWAKSADTLLAATLQLRVGISSSCAKTQSTVQKSTKLTCICVIVMFHCVCCIKNIYPTLIHHTHTILFYYTQPAAVSCKDISQKKPSGQGIQPVVALPLEKVPMGQGITVPFPGQ